MISPSYFILFVNYLYFSKSEVKDGKTLFLSFFSLSFFEIVGLQNIERIKKNNINLRHEEKP